MLIIAIKMCVCVIHLSLDLMLESQSQDASPKGKSSELIMTQSLGKARTLHTTKLIPLAQRGTVTTCAYSKIQRFP